MIHTIAPGYGDAFKKDQEQQAHSTGRVVVKQFEHIDSTLGAEKWTNVIERLVQVQNDCGVVFHAIKETTQNLDALKFTCNI